MKQEIVIKVQMRCDKCRTKSMELAASADGVSSISLTGEDRNQLVVVGDGVDAVSMATILRKKVGPTNIIRVGEPNKNNNGDKKSNKSDNDEKKEKSTKDSDSGKEKEKVQKKDEKKDSEQQYHRYQYQYQQPGPKMEYVQVQQEQQWYPGYPVFPQPQIVVYDSPNYSSPNCSIM